MQVNRYTEDGENDLFPVENAGLMVLVVGAGYVRVLFV